MINIELPTLTSNITYITCSAVPPRQKPLQETQLTQASSAPRSFYPSRPPSARRPTCAPRATTEVVTRRVVLLSIVFKAKTRFAASKVLPGQRMSLKLNEQQKTAKGRQTRSKVAKGDFRGSPGVLFGAILESNFEDEEGGGVWGMSSGSFGSGE